MSVPAFFWPPSGATARGVSLAPFGAGMAVPDWTQPVLWPFSGSAFLPGIAIGSGTYGFSSSATDASGGLWMTSWDGILSHVSSGGTLLSAVAMPSGQAYVGTACCAGSGFAASSSGIVYTGAAAQLGTFPVSLATLASSGTTLAAVLPASGIGLMNANTGATGFVSLPAGMSVPACMALASGRPIVVAGWSNAALLSGAVAAAQNLQNPASMVAVGSGYAYLWTAPSPYSDAWTQSQAVSGLASLAGVAWRPDGAQALAVSAASGLVQVLGYALDVLSIGQVLSVSGACSIAVAGNSINALVAQSGQAQLATLTYGGSAWAAGSPVTGMTGIVAVAGYGASGAIAAVASGLQYLTLTSGGIWSPSGTVSLGFAPKSIAVDSFGQVYAAGSGMVAMASGTSLLATGSWSGGVATAVAVQQGRIAVAVPSDSLLRVFGLSSPGSLSQQYSTAMSSGSPAGLALSTTTLFAMAPSGTAMYGFSGSPFALTPVLSGSVSFWNGSAWSGAAMGPGHVPTAVGFDSYGDAWVSTRQNTLWCVTQVGGVLFSGALQQYPGQPQTTPLCVSSLLASGSIYAATSIAGILALASPGIDPTAFYTNANLAAAGMLAVGQAAQTSGLVSFAAQSALHASGRAAIAGGMLGFAGTSVFQTPIAGTQAIRARDFTKYMAVETQMKDATEVGSSSPYYNATNILAQLDWFQPKGRGTGINLIRETPLDPAPMSTFEYWGSLGYKFIMGYFYPEPQNETEANQTASKNNINLLISSGYVSIVEGFNEVNTFGPYNPAGNYDSPTGNTYTNATQAVCESQIDTWNFFNGSGSIGIASWSIGDQSTGLGLNGNVFQTEMTSLGHTYGSVMNYGNAHMYMTGGYAPGDNANGNDADTQLAANCGAQQVLGIPNIVTETGFVGGNPGSVPSNGAYNGKYGNDYINAIYTLEMYLHGYNTLKLKCLVIYEMDDDAPDDGTQETHFGLFYVNGYPKGQAASLNAFMQVVSDAGATAASFSPTKLNFSIAGGPSNMETLLMENSSGQFILVVWQNTTIYAGGTYTAAPQDTITVSFGQTITTAQRFDPIAVSVNTSVVNNSAWQANTPAITPVQTVSNAASITFVLGDGPMILLLTP